MIYLVYLIVISLILFFLYKQFVRGMIFHPKYIRDERLYDEHYRFITIKTDDGVALEGCVYQKDKDAPVVIYFGGRGQDSVGLLPKLAMVYPHYTIVTFNYRGYGKSGGKASLEHLYNDSVKISDIIQKHYGRHSVFGYSLGSSCASYVASQKEVKKIVLIGAFYSIEDVIYKKYNIKLPFFSFNFQNCIHLKKTKAPVALFVSEDDSIVPIESSLSLLECKKDIQCFRYKHLNHVELLWDQKVVNDIQTFLQ